MNTEVMTIRRALTQKKLLDKQIEKMGEAVYVANFSILTPLVEGMSVKNWTEKAMSEFQSLNDKILRREALSTAVIKANAENEVEVPVFVAFGEPQQGMEKITFAGAIARKNYLNWILDNVLYTMEANLRDEINGHTKAVEEAEKIVQKRLAEEFGSVTQAATSARKEREEELRKLYDVALQDPNEIAKKIGRLKEYIEEYNAEIDAILGHATEVTEITVTY